MLLLQKSLFLCGVYVCVCVRLLVNNVKGNDNDFVDIHYAFFYYAAVQTICFNHLFFLFFCFSHFILTPNSMTGGTIVQEENVTLFD